MTPTPSPTPTSTTTVATTTTLPATTTTIEGSGGTATTSTTIAGGLPATGNSVPVRPLIWLALALAVPGVALVLATRRSGSLDPH